MNTNIMYEALGKARDMFKLYAELHRAKGTVDSDAKAKVNEDMVAIMNEALSVHPDALPELPVSEAFSLTRSVYTADDMYAYDRAAIASRDAETAKLRQGEPVAVPWKSVVAAIIAVHDEVRRRGSMFPQTSDERADDRAAVHRVNEMIEWYATKGGCVAERLDAWPKPASPPPAQPPTEWTDAKLRGIASDYFTDSKDWPAAMLCLRHLLMEQGAAQPAPANENDWTEVDLWAEIHRLRAAVKGPEGYDSWQDAATAERIRRVKAEAALDKLVVYANNEYWPGKFMQEMKEFLNEK